MDNKCTYKELFKKAVQVVRKPHIDTTKLRKIKVETVLLTIINLFYRVISVILCDFLNVSPLPIFRIEFKLGDKRHFFIKYCFLADR